MSALAMSCGLFPSVLSFLAFFDLPQVIATGKGLHGRQRNLT